jgi:riboflavin kinase
LNTACNSYFTGRVFSGVGEGSFYVSLYSKRFLEKLGFKPYPGTLNLRLLEDVEVFNICLSRANHILIEPPSIPGVRLGAVHAYPAEVEGYFNPSVFIVRPVITIYKSDVVELIADTSLRETLNIRDGQTIRFKIRTMENNK